MGPAAVKPVLASQLPEVCRWMACAPGRQIVQVEGDQHAAIDGGEIHLPDRLALQVLQMGDGMGLLRGIRRRGQRQQRLLQCNEIFSCAPQALPQRPALAMEPGEPGSRPALCAQGECEAE